MHTKRCTDVNNLCFKTYYYLNLLYFVQKLSQLSTKKEVQSNRSNVGSIQHHKVFLVFFCQKKQHILSFPKITYDNIFPQNQILPTDTQLVWKVMHGVLAVHTSQQAQTKNKLHQRKLSWTIKVIIYIEDLEFDFEQI